MGVQRIMQNHVKTGSEFPRRQKLNVAPKVMLSIAVDNSDIVAPEAHNACEIEGRPCLTVTALRYTDCEDEWTDKRPIGRGGRSSLLDIHSPIVLHTTPHERKNIAPRITALSRSVSPTCSDPLRATLINILKD
jgi:hypothetical protein